ncbi:MAG: hypothetical protein OIF47_16780 [Marinibacterium sp.]|nr:hypothetical protein [Marinibacterium sp.]
MTAKTVLAALALTALPVLAWAQCDASKALRAQSCMSGTEWDASAGRCVKIVNS